MREGNKLITVNELCSDAPDAMDDVSSVPCSHMVGWQIHWQKSQKYTCNQSIDVQLKISVIMISPVLMTSRVYVQFLPCFQKIGWKPLYKQAQTTIPSRHIYKNLSPIPLWCDETKCQGPCFSRILWLVGGWWWYCGRHHRGKSWLISTTIVHNIHRSILKRIDHEDHILQLCLKMFKL